jgi:cytosine/uracil/thiamine/allantoin permease
MWRAKRLTEERIGWFHFFGYWTLSSLNISNWQSPNTFLSELPYGVPAALHPIGRPYGIVRVWKADRKMERLTVDL